MGVERMAAHIDAEQLFFPRELIDERDKFAGG